MRHHSAVVRAGSGAPQDGSPFMAGPVFAGSYFLAGEPHDGVHGYARFSNPTWSAYESALAELEGGPCLVFASGMAAAAAVLCSVLGPGDILVIPSDGYYTLRLLALGYLARMGVEVRTAPTRDGMQREHLDGCRLLLLESPTNPGLDVCDLPELIRLAHTAGALVAVDNTTATALSQQPLRMGADFSVCSDTKALTGHNDLVLGHVAAANERLLRGVRAWRDQAGGVAGPMETWLAHRSLATAALRLERQSDSAQRVAGLIAHQALVTVCRYPGLPGDPAYALARRQMRLTGPVVSFTLGNEADATRWIRSLRLISPATSFGGIRSTAERRARWSGEEVHPGLIRLSIGIEACDDLLEDIAAAFASL